MSAEASRRCGRRRTVVGRIDFKIRQGVITLEGEVPSLSQKRLSGVLAWQIPGPRNVIDELAVRPAENDSDELIANAVRQALDKDPLVHAAGIRVNAQDRLVTLEGAVPAAGERDEAERDAWCVIGVGGVLNRLEVHASQLSPRAGRRHLVDPLRAGRLLGSP